MKLLINNFERELRELADTAIEIKVLIAFLTESGLSGLPESQIARADFIVGVNLGITTPGALQRLQGGGAAVRVFCRSGASLPPPRPST